MRSQKLPLSADTYFVRFGFGRKKQKDESKQMDAVRKIKLNQADWWKYPDSFLKVIMNTGETQQVTRDDINSEILESLIPGWERQRRFLMIRS